MTLGQSIAKHRKMNGMTQAGLAEQLIISPTTVSGWEQDRTEPSIMMIRCLTKVFDCTTDELLDDGQEEKRTNNDEIYVGLCKELGTMIPRFVKENDMQTALTILHAKTAIENLAYEKNRAGFEEN